MHRTFLFTLAFLAASPALLFAQGRFAGHAGTLGSSSHPLGITPSRGYSSYNRGNGYGRYGYGYGIAAYPVYVGDYGLYGYGLGYGDQSQPAQPNVTIVNAPPAPPAPPVIINQYFGAPPPNPEDANMRIYQTPQSQPVAAGAEVSEPRSYLIAYKDHSVYSALAYWVEDHTLHYVTTANTHNQADLGLIDLDFTRKLNQDRNMPFDLKLSR